MQGAELFQQIMDSREGVGVPLMEVKRRRSGGPPGLAPEVGAPSWAWALDPWGLLPSVSVRVKPLRRRPAGVRESCLVWEEKPHAWCCERGVVRECKRNTQEEK